MVEIVTKAHACYKWISYAEQNEDKFSRLTERVWLQRLDNNYSSNQELHEVAKLCSIIC